MASKINNNNKICISKYYDKLGINKACLNLLNNDKKYTLDVWAQSEECYSVSNF